MTDSAPRSRPRPSVLSLFDPLLATQEPSTPPRNGTPEADSDKENSNPPRTDLTLTTFFNRTYKPNHQLEVKPLRRRLVDVGDVTVDDVDDCLLAEDPDSDDGALDLADLEDNENDTLTFRQMAEAATPKWNSSFRRSKFQTPSPSVLRAPLSELSLDADATPLAKHKLNFKHTSSGPSMLSKGELPSITLTSTDPVSRQPQPRCSNLHENGEASSRPGASCNSLLNSVSSIQLHSAGLPGSLLTETVAPNFAASVAHSEASSNSSIPPSHLRPNPPKTSSHDTNRNSIDLQTSFQLHLGNGSDFDLLNDKVTFLGTSRNASYLDDDTSFDLSFGDSVPIENVGGARAAAFQFHPPRKSLDFSLTELREDNKVEKQLKKNPIAFHELSNQTPEGPSSTDDESPNTKACRSLETVVSTDVRPIAVMPPQPVAGLRIIKRLKAALPKKVESPNPVRSASGHLLSPRAETASSPIPVPSRQSREAPRQRDSSQAISTTQSSDAKLTTSSLFRRTSVEVIAPVAKHTRTGSVGSGVGPAPASRATGPRRIPVAESSESKPIARRAPAANVEESTSSLQNGPRRLPVTERTLMPKGSMSALASRQSNATSNSGIARIQSARSNAGSSLPQPTVRASRLPAPSGSTRPSALPARSASLRRGI